MNDGTFKLPDDQDGETFVAAFARGLAVIRAFDAGREYMTLADIGRITGLSRATVRRSLLTLQTLGYVSVQGRQFRLTPRVLSLGYSYLASTPLPRIMQPILEQVSERVHESSSACILDGPEIVYVARSATKRIMSVGLSVGSRLPAYCTSMGRVLLAAEPAERRRDILGAMPLRKLTATTETSLPRLNRLLDEIADLGYALVDQELEIGLRSIAVPVRNRAGQVVAAMNVSTHAGRLEVSKMTAKVLPILRNAAQAMTASIVA